LSVRGLPSSAGEEASTDDDARKIIAVILGLVAAFFLYVVVTIPLIAATAPAILLLACALGAYFVWPKGSATAAPGPTTASNAQQPTRPCPSCKGAMGAAESVCPHCGQASRPWVFHAGVWWVQGTVTGRWVWFDNQGRIWRWYSDGTPMDADAPDKTPNLLIDPAVVSPPVVEATASSEAQATESFTGELERLADLHHRGALSDEQFEVAKSRLLGLSKGWDRREP
jgi:Short C-terminal domain